MEHRVVGALDIGSGSTKLVVGKVLHSREMTESGASRDIVEIVETLYEEDYCLLLSHDLEQNGGEELSEAALKQCEETVARLKDICVSRYGAKLEDVFGVGTQVFRRAKNGPGFLATLGTRLDMDLRVISQEEEGRLGFATGVACLTRHDRVDGIQNLVVWDSGSGSFQFSEQGNHMLGGRIGDTTVTQLLCDIKGKRLGKETVNPVEREEMEALCEKIASLLRGIAMDEFWKGKLANGETQISAIGGDGSPFQTCELLLRNCDTNRPRLDNVYTLEQVEKTLDYSLRKDDAFFRELGIEQPDMTVPQLALMRETLRWIGHQKFIYRRSVGGCVGLIVSRLTGAL